MKDVVYKNTKLSGKSIKFEIPKYDELYVPTMPEHPFYTYHDKKFCKDHLMYSTIPLHIGSFDIPFDPTQIVNVLRCAIKKEWE